MYHLQQPEINKIIILEFQPTQLARAKRYDVKEWADQKFKDRNLIDASLYTYISMYNDMYNNM